MDDEAGKQRLESHLDECAGKAGEVFGLGIVTEARRDAPDRNDRVAFLVTAAQVRDILRGLARLTSIPDEELDPGGSAHLEVPHQLIRAARENVINWDRD